MYNAIFKNNLSFHQFVEQFDNNDIHNTQALWISGLHQATDEQLVTQALQNIKQHFSFVGLLEEYNTSLLLLSKLYGWGIPYYKQRNKGSYNRVKKNIEQKTLDLIAEKNAADLKLYSFVEQEFLKKKNKISFLSQRLKLLKYANIFQSSYKINKLKKLIFLD